MAADELNTLIMDLTIAASHDSYMSSCVDCYKILIVTISIS